jgi:hypothetical protein
VKMTMSVVMVKVGMRNFGMILYPREA